ncbi:acylphosphatase [Coleophoma cylindrospora]|uniref:acylphosphatase n=1 Tax=Coleophoma cylindrospora TaxID=1849047 RepID=A0A3D8R5P8_9HELO|nr:acylphosphatase [Coleophoma cylindrospora]
MSQRISFLVHGDVQGVSFRYFTQKKAQEYNLTGWVRNTPNSKVEGEAQGDKEGIQNLLKDLDNGPRMAHVVKVEKEDKDVVEGEKAFEVRR